MKSPRRRAREFVLQGLYQWQLAGAPACDIENHLKTASGFERADQELFQRLLNGTLSHAGELEALLTPHLDRPYGELSPVERSVLLLAAYELRHCPETPYKVVLNEAIELTKDYGANEGHKFVNGVLDKLAAELRPHETKKGVRSAG
ncbi:MAG: transcription antitermination factor NusB [Pseudomonadota bacterium]